MNQPDPAVLRDYAKRFEEAASWSPEKNKLHLAAAKALTFQADAIEAQAQLDAQIADVNAMFRGDK